MSDNVHTPELLKEYQSYPLDVKILMTERRIHEYYTGYGSIGYGNAYVSFSGGKDSTVLLAIARKLYPDIRACFCNTGLEYPEIQSFVKRHENIDIVRPTLRFDEVISQYGYPLIGKEVAEAIYYARRIRSAERERETRRRRELDRNEYRTKPPYCADGEDALRHTHTQRRQSYITDENCTGNGVQTAGTVRAGTMQSRGEWADWRRGCL